MVTRKPVGEGPTSKPAQYAFARRSLTTRQRPFIDLAPVGVSLTDGTGIPPPAPDPQPEAKPEPRAPTSPKIPKEKPRIDVATAAAAAAVKAHAQSPTGGPLKSHPVTPSDTEAVNGAYFEAQRAQQRQSTANGAATMTQQQQDGATGSDTVRPPTSSVRPPTSGTLGGRGSGQSESEGTSSRRPSFASRLFRLRGLSSLRSRNPSQLTLSQHVDDVQQGEGPARQRKSSDVFGGSTRGVKRPASPNPADTLDYAGGGGQTVPHSFPRMMRKKSMELFGSARRKSGLWSGRSEMEQTAMAEEAQLEQQREQGDEAGERGPSRMEVDGRGSIGGRSGRYSSLAGRASGRTSSMGKRESIAREPAPTLPELKEFRELEGEDLFANIGRE